MPVFETVGQGELPVEMSFSIIDVLCSTYE
jgi:hypothetical protein